MIRVNNVVKTFGDFRALDGVNLHVRDGAIYGLVGPNGAGKSTIIRHITGIYKPDAGNIEIAGMPVYENPQAKARFAYIPDDLFYFQQADVMEMKRFYKGIYKTFDEDLFFRIRDAFSNIDPKMTIRRMSKGMQKQAAFLLAISCKPELMVLDEPVDGLDPVMRRQVWSLLMGDVAQRGTTVLVSSHNLRELEDICDHVGLLHQGGVLLSKDLEEMKCNIQKIQCVFSSKEEEKRLLKQLDIVKCDRRGSLLTLTVRGSREEMIAMFAAADCLFHEVLPLSLEEIFISETEVQGYDIKKIVLG